MPLGEQRTLLAVFAHPDDESFGIGGTLARYAAEGVRVGCWPALRWGRRERYECFFLAGSRLEPGREPETDLFAAVR